MNKTYQNDNSFCYWIETFFFQWKDQILQNLNEYIRRVLIQFHWISMYQVHLFTMLGLPLIIDYDSARATGLYYIWRHYPFVLDTIREGCEDNIFFSLKKD